MKKNSLKIFKNSGILRLLNIFYNPKAQIKNYRIGENVTKNLYCIQTTIKNQKDGKLINFMFRETKNLVYKKLGQL